jgi:hypothetical protein
MRDKTHNSIKEMSGAEIKWPYCKTPSIKMNRLSSSELDFKENSDDKVEKDKDES